MTRLLDRRAHSWRRWRPTTLQTSSPWRWMYVTRRTRGFMSRWVKNLISEELRNWQSRYLFFYGFWVDCRPLKSTLRGSNLRSLRHQKGRKSRLLVWDFKAAVWSGGQEEVHWGRSVSLRCPWHLEEGLHTRCAHGCPVLVISQPEHHSGSSLLRGSVPSDVHLPAQPLHLRPGWASLFIPPWCPLEHPHHVGQRCTPYGMETPFCCSVIVLVLLSAHIHLWCFLLQRRNRPTFMEPILFIWLWRTGGPRTASSCSTATPWVSLLEAASQIQKWDWLQITTWSNGLRTAADEQFNHGFSLILSTFLWLLSQNIWTCVFVVNLCRCEPPACSSPHLAHYWRHLWLLRVPWSWSGFSDWTVCGSRRSVWGGGVCVSFRCRNVSCDSFKRVHRLPDDAHLLGFGLPPLSVGLRG